MNQYDSELSSIKGDKVRIKQGEFKSRRGVLHQIDDDGTLVEVICDDNHVIRLPAAHVTNYSLAARKAWKQIPKKAGRPKIITTSRKTVSFRIETDVWMQIGEAVAKGLVTSREYAVNQWIKEGLQNLEVSEDGSTKSNKDGKNS